MVQTCSCRMHSGGFMVTAPGCAVHGKPSAVHVTFTHHRDAFSYCVPNGELYRLLPAHEQTPFRIPGET